MKIEIILPNFNGSRTIAKSITSFLRQSHNEKNIIIVDGKSTDDSHQIISEFCVNENVKWINKIDNGISDAINIASKETTGDIIGYLGSDDILCFDILSKINHIFEFIQPDIVVCSSATYYKKEKKFDYRDNMTLVFNRENLLKYGTLVGLQNVFFRNEVFKLLEMNVDNKYSMDYEFYLSLLDTEQLTIYYLNERSTINGFEENISYLKSHDQTLEAIRLGFKFSRSLKNIFGSQRDLLNTICGKL